MSVIPQGFEQYPQFFLWRPEILPNGKVTKIPTSPGGYDISAHDPGNWMSAEQVAAEAARTGLGMAFSITEQDPFWFLDIDECYSNGAWSPLATGLCAQFAGASVEVSQSGRGLHIFGAGQVPAHRCRRDDIGLEFYTQGRFVALGGHGARGNALSDHTEAVGAFVAKYMAPDEVTGADASWTDYPDPEWSGPEDDAELVERMLRSVSASGIFSGRATVKQLWEADPVALATSYPSVSGGTFDHSSADAALCQHLAFWTGKDCARMDRLFRQSALMRDKWNGRQDYRESTILRATARCNAVLKSGGSPDVPTGAGPGSPGPEMRQSLQFLTPEQQTKHFAGCVYVRDIHRMFVPDGALIKPDQFKAMFGGYVFALDTINSKTTRNAWEAFTESQAIKFPKVTGICFRPEHEPGAIIEDDGATLVNTYVPIETPRRRGDPGPFLAHIVKMLPVERDRQILLAYMAACVQHIGSKFQWAPLIQGCEGNGKSLIISAIARAIGHKYTHLPNAADIGNKFNSWMLNKLFIGVEELYVADRQELVDALKPMITNRRIDIQAKGRDQITGDNRANFVMNSNHKDAWWKTKHDRRICMFYTAQQEAGDLLRDGMAGDYFPNLYKWLRADGYAIVTDYLSRYEIPDELNPATSCHRAPETSSTDEAVSMSLGSIEQEVLEAIDEGRAGFAGGWVSSFAFDRMLDETRGRRVPRAKRRRILQSLGYDWHPGLRDGRASSVIASEGGKPRLFIRNGHISAGLVGGKQIVQAFLDAQNKNITEIFEKQA